MVLRQTCASGRGISAPAAGTLPGQAPKACAGGVLRSHQGREDHRSMLKTSTKWSRPTRLETRTKEFDICASVRVIENPVAVPRGAARRRVTKVKVGSTDLGGKQKFPPVRGGQDPLPHHRPTSRFYQKVRVRVQLSRPERW